MIEESIKLTEPPTEKEINLWDEYEKRKAELPGDLNAVEYADAVQRIARELGI